MRKADRASGATKRTSNYAGKTYNSVDSIRDFFAKRTGGAGEPPSPSPKAPPSAPSAPSAPRGSGKFNPGNLNPGARVKHPKYGVGLLLKREGTGDDAKLTVTFPGYGQKKFIAKFAQLERA